MKYLIVGTMGLLLAISIPVQKTYSETTEINPRAEVEFESNADIIKPVDPGEKNEIEIEANRPPTKGPLSINYVSAINFGKQRLKRERQEIYAVEDTVTHVESGAIKKYPNFIQVTDLRGTSAGWSLSVKQNGPLKTAQGRELLGAVLSVKVDEVVSQYQMKQTPSYSFERQPLFSDGESFHELVRATKGTGMSTWNIFIGSVTDASQNVTLDIPANMTNQTGHYTTSLTWLLSDGL